MLVFYTIFMIKSRNMRKIVKNTTLPHPLDLFAPHSCKGCGRIGNVLCDRCKKNITSNPINFCPQCKNPTQNGKCNNCPKLPPIFITGERQGLLDILIHDFKYQSVRALAQPLAELLDATLPANLGNQITIVPLPTISKHIRTRGLDHTYLIAKHLAHLRHYQVQKLLYRTNNTIQVGADRAARLKQAAQAYGITPHVNINPKATYLLLDDVWTTGASILSAAQKLQQVGIKNLSISILALSCID